MRIPDSAKPVLAVLAALAAVVFTAPAQAQCPPDSCTIAGSSIWLGDLNNDGAVDEDDEDF